MPKKFPTPILIIGFNRPDLLEAVLRRTLKVRPEKIYVALDGPRTGNRNDRQKCREARELTQKLCQGKCRLKTLFHSKNNGCKYGPYKAINWFFSLEEEGVILEDDVLADQSFFYFAQEVLERYRTDERIAGLSGNNFQFGRRRTRDSYYFSRFSHTSGWATWRRVWQLYDITMKDWPTLKKGDWLRDILGDGSAIRYWTLIFDRVKTGQMNTAWDYQWTYMCWKNNMLSILPNQNLVSNIGFGIQSATHTKTKSKFANIPAIPIKLPLCHPRYVIRDTQADNRTQKNNYVLWKELGLIAIQRLKRR